MDNPWADLPIQPPHVLTMDEAAVRRAGCFRTDVVPEPFVGDPSAPVVVLMKAPGFDDADVAAHARPEVATAIRRSHRAGPGSFHPLEAELAGTPSERWWRPKLDGLIAASNEDSVRANLFVAQLHPYHFQRAIPDATRIPSAEFTYDVVRDAVMGGALVVLVSGRPGWKRVLGRTLLQGAIQPASLQSAHLTRNNLREGFDDVIAAIRGTDGTHVGSSTSATEGRPIEVKLSRWERNPRLRQACIDALGSSCHACGVDMGERYGSIGAGYIHVHHLTPGATAGERIVHPVEDLRPVCPNCHAMFHTSTPPLTIEQLQGLLST